MFTFAFSAEFSEKPSESFIFILSIAVFIFFALVIVGFIIWSKKSKKPSKEFWEMYNKQEQQKIDNQAINAINGTDYYNDLPKYNDINYFYIYKSISTPKIFGLFFSLLVAISSSICLILNFNYYFQVNFINFDYVLVVFCSILLVLSSYCLYYIIKRKGEKNVSISKDGVLLKRKIDGELKTRHFTWEKIKVIGISVAPSGRRISWGFLYFTTKEIKKDRVIPEYFEKPYVIMLKYRPKVVHCILQYWDKEIRNLEAMKSWCRYINKL